MKSFALFDWFKRLGISCRMRPVFAGAEKAGRGNAAFLRLEPLEPRVTPSNTVARLTSPVAASYLSTSDVILVDVIGQLQDSTANPAQVQRVLVQLSQVQGNLDRFLDDLNSGVQISRTLKSDLRGMVKQLDQLIHDLHKQGDLQVPVPSTDDLLSLRSVVKDIESALSALACNRNLAKLPPADVVFAAEAGLPGVTS